MQALALSLMEPSEASGKRKLEDGTRVDCSERDRGWQRYWMRKLVENLRAGRTKRDELKWKMRKIGKIRCRGSVLLPIWVTRFKRQCPAVYCKRNAQCSGMFWFRVWMELLLLHVSALFCKLMKHITFKVLSQCRAECERAWGTQRPETRVNRRGNVLLKYSPFPFVNVVWDGQSASFLLGWTVFLPTWQINLACKQVKEMKKQTSLFKV